MMTACPGTLRKRNAWFKALSSPPQAKINSRPDGEHEEHEHRHGGSEPGFVVRERPLVGVDRERPDVSLRTAALDHEPRRIELRKHPDASQQDDHEQDAL